VVAEVRKGPTASASVSSSRKSTCVAFGCSRVTMAMAVL